METDPAVRHPKKASPRIRGVLRNRPSATPDNAWRGMGDAYTALSTIITGIGLWGAVGYGLDRLLGTKPWLMVVGIIVGNFAAIYLIYVRALREEETRGAA